MAHVRLQWTPERYGEPDTVVVEVHIGFNRDAPLRSAGSLRLHASELNAVDRLLQRGETWEQPTHTYEITAAEELPAAAGERR